MIFSKSHGAARIVPAAAILSAAAMAGMAVAETLRARRAEADNPPRGRFVEVDGVRLHYVQQGEGPDVVMLHGNGAMFEEFASSGLIERAAGHFRVTVIERPGFGHSDRPRDRLWTPAAQAELLARAFPRLGISRPVVLGHSMGTMVAVALALEQVVSGLVLLSGYYFPTPRVDAPIFAPPAIPVVGDVMRYTISPALGRLMAPKIIGRMFEPMPVPERFWAEYPIEMALRPSQLRAVAEDTAFMVPAAAVMAPRYSELRLPVAIMAGAEDKIVDPERQSALLYQELEANELRLVPDVGHMVHHAVPDEVVAMIGRVARG